MASALMPLPLPYNVSVITIHRGMKARFQTNHPYKAEIMGLNPSLALLCVRDEKLGHGGMKFRPVAGDFEGRSH
jgi:hypothetical protein